MTPNEEKINDAWDRFLAGVQAARAQMGYKYLPAVLVCAHVTIAGGDVTMDPMRPTASIWTPDAPEDQRAGFLMHAATNQAGPKTTTKVLIG